MISPRTLLAHADQVAGDRCHSDRTLDPPNFHACSVHYNEEIEPQIELVSLKTVRLGTLIDGPNRTPLLTGSFGDPALY